MNFLKKLKRKRDDEGQPLVGEEESHSQLPKKKKLKESDSAEQAPKNIFLRLLKNVKKRFSGLFKESTAARRRRIFGTPAKELNKTYIMTPTKPFSPKSCINQWRQCNYYTLNEVLPVTETKHFEFKTGGGNYPIQILPEHVRKYGSAFLNSDGGVLLAGVLDNGTVRGITANSRKKIDILGKIDDEFSKFVPRVDRSMYTINFVPVAFPQRHREKWRDFLKDLYVLELSVKKGIQTEIYEDGRHHVFVRREASVEGPLPPLKIKDLVIQKYVKALRSQREKEDGADKSQDDSIVYLGTRPTQPSTALEKKRAKLGISPIRFDL